MLSSLESPKAVFSSHEGRAKLGLRLFTYRDLYLLLTQLAWKEAPKSTFISLKLCPFSPLFLSQAAQCRWSLYSFGRDSKGIFLLKLIRSEQWGFLGFWKCSSLTHFQCTSRNTLESGYDNQSFSIIYLIFNAIGCPFSINHMTDILLFNNSSYTFTHSQNFVKVYAYEDQVLTPLLHILDWNSTIFPFNNPSCKVTGLLLFADAVSSD